MNSSKKPLVKANPHKIFLIGFMGTGKSYWGERWAKNLDLSFFDLDKLVEDHEGRSVSDIFEKYGEEHFRKIETAILRQFDKKDNYILACGGGTPCFEDNMKWMNKEGITIYLKASPGEILERVLTDQKTRPLIKNLNKSELLFFIEQKLREREHYYSMGTFNLPVSELAEDSIDHIIRNARA